MCASPSTHCWCNDTIIDRKGLASRLYLHGVYHPRIYYDHTAVSGHPRCANSRCSGTGLSFTCVSHGIRLRKCPVRIGEDIKIDTDHAVPWVTRSDECHPTASCRHIARACIGNDRSSSHRRLDRDPVALAISQISGNLRGSMPCMVTLPLFLLDSCFTGTTSTP
jgi:hypothetical protein